MPLSGAARKLRLLGRDANFYENFSCFSPLFMLFKLIIDYTAEKKHCFLFDYIRKTLILWRFNKFYLRLFPRD